MTMWGDWISDQYDAAATQAAAIRDQFPVGTFGAITVPSDPRAATSIANLADAASNANQRASDTLSDLRGSFDRALSAPGDALSSLRGGITSTGESVSRAVRWAMIAAAVIAIILLILFAMYLYGLFRLGSKALDILPDVAKPLGEGIALGAVA